jgi:AbrB family looped-hinge helix DNA binding protein
MEKIVTITSQGQLTLPKALRKAFGIKGTTKALVRKEGNLIMVQPKGDFWSLAGSLDSKISLTDKQLRNARNAFAKQWSRNI